MHPWPWCAWFSSFAGGEEEEEEEDDLDNE
jgi:hypothetical protein